MNVIHFVSDLDGGAGKATIRQHEGLIKYGIHSRLFTLHDATTVDDSYKQTSAINQLFLEHAQKNISPYHTMFSYPNLGLSTRTLDMIIQDNDIVNLHWIDNLLSIENIAYLTHSNIPVVWTVHDKLPFSGGCHYFHGCEHWKTGCADCPQLRHSLEDMPARVFSAKQQSIYSHNLTFVVLNAQFNAIAHESVLFEDARIETIYNSVDLEVFTPATTVDCNKMFRRTHGIPQNKKIIFYTAAYASKIKGYAEFCKTMKCIGNTDEYHLLLAGDIPQGTTHGLSVTYLGYIDQPTMIAAYQCADVTLVPSTEDNLPNICLESLACGTPVVGFKVGGIPDLVKDGYNGYTVELGDCKALAAAVEKVLKGPPLFKHCRDFAEQQLSQSLQAQKYVELYESLVSTSKSSIQKQTKKNSKQLLVLPIAELAVARTPIYQELLCSYGQFRVKWNTRKRLAVKILKKIIPRGIVAKIKARRQAQKSWGEC